MKTGFVAQYDLDAQRIGEDAGESLAKMTGNQKHLATVIFLGMLLIANTIMLVAKYKK